MPGVRARAVTAASWLAGRPWRLSPARRKPLSLEDRRLKRIVVLKPCCMGDVLMATPALAALRKALPKAHISLVVGEHSQPAVAGNPRLDVLVDTWVGRVGASFADYRSLGRVLRRGHYGTALVLDRSPLLNAAARMGGIPVRAGLDSDHRGLALTHPVACPSSVARHEVQWYLDVVRALGIPAPEEVAYLEFYPNDEERRVAGGLISEMAGESEGGPVALHLGGGSNPGMKLPSKRWHPRLWARVVEWLTETYETDVLLLGGPGIEDRDAAAELLDALHPASRPYVKDLVGKIAWGVMAAVIERCRLFMGHDTGAMHLATAVCTPVVAVFGPSDPVRYGPWDLTGRSRVVAPAAVRSGAESLRGAARTGELYNTLVTAEEVWAAVQTVYARASAPAETKR